MVTTTVFTDGACSGNPGRGGWAWAVPDGPFASGFAEASTNQRMEMTAVLEAMRAMEGSLHVVSDSEYVVKCFNDRWYVRWEETGWKNSSRQPVANRDLWEEMLAIYRKRGDVTFEWVKGHAGNVHNDLVDRLAVEAAESQKGRSGKKPPKLPDRPDASAAGHPNNPSANRSFSAKFAGKCANCQIWFPIATPLVRNRDGKYVHAGGCPSKT